MKQNIFIYVFFLLVAQHAALAADDIQTQDNVQSDACEQCGLRFKHVLGDHAFLPSSLIPRSFADSNAFISMGFGYKELANSAFGENRELKLGAFSPAIAGAVSVTPSLSILFGVNGNVIAGMDTLSVVQYGSSVGYAFTLGSIYELFRTKTQVFSVALELDRPHSFSASPLVAVQDEVKNLSGQSNTDFISTKAETTWRPSLRYSQALSPIFGFQSYLGFRLSSISQDGNSSYQSRLSLGVGVDSDLKKWVNVPLGWMINCVHGQALNSGDTTLNQVSLGIYETQTRTFNVGFEIGRIYAGDSNSTLGAIFVRAYYN